jgi:hypothetical protein
MLIKGKELKGYRLDSKDGPIGSAREFYFDDHYWSIRYLVAKTSGWLSNNKVLLSPTLVQDRNCALIGEARGGLRRSDRLGLLRT